MQIVFELENIQHYYLIVEALNYSVIQREQMANKIEIGHGTADIELWHKTECEILSLKKIIETINKKIN